MRGSVLALVITSCSAPDPAQLVVAVGTDMALDALAVVEVGDGTVEGRMPFSFGVVPLNGDESRTVTIVAHSQGVTRRAVTGFVAGEARLLPMFLCGECLDTVCEAGETCTEAGCASERVPPETLAIVRPGEELDGFGDWERVEIVEGPGMVEVAVAYRNAAPLETTPLRAAESRPWIRRTPADPETPPTEDPGPPPCPAACNGACGTDGTCFIRSSVPGRIVCPPDRPCDVRCLGEDACDGGVDCTQATSCNIECRGVGACDDGPTACDGASCAIVCEGLDACDQGVCCSGGDCASSCTASDGGCCECGGCL